MGMSSIKGRWSRCRLKTWKLAFGLSLLLAAAQSQPARAEYADYRTPVFAVTGRGLLQNSGEGDPFGTFGSLERAPTEVSVLYLPPRVTGLCGPPRQGGIDAKATLP